MKSLRIFSKLWVKDVLPPGSVTDFAGVTAPDGWLLCYGQEVSRTDYADLFLAIGTTYGVGDGSTTFNLPDCRGRVKAGKDNMGGVAANILTTLAIPVGGGATLGATGGSQVHSIQTSEVGAHNHTQNSHTHTATFELWRNDTGDTHANGTSRGHVGRISDNLGNPANASGTAMTDSGAVAVNVATPASSPHQNTQPTIIFNTIIKV